MGTNSLKSETKSTSHWLCAKWRSHKCPMARKTCDKTIISFNHEHIHEFKSGRVEARQLVSQLKETAKSQINPVKKQWIATSVRHSRQIFANYCI